MLRPYRKEWTMIFVGSAAEALREMSGSTVDTLVTDLQMDRQTGFDLLRAVSASSGLGHVPVIIMTGAAERDLKRRALDLGATDLLNKPVDSADLIARIRSALRLKSYQDQIRDQNELLERKVRDRTRELDESRVDLIWRLARVAEFRDEQTGHHIMRVGSYCKVLADALGMPHDFAETIFLTSPLHDIGKIGIPDAILRRPGTLTAADWNVMRRHCAIGAEILRQDIWMQPPGGDHPPVEQSEGDGGRRNPFLEMASAIALAHHEWWDGTGYPCGLSGEAIPLEARIVAVADVYDALSSARPYKPALPEDKVVDIMDRQVRTHFDPAVYEAFRRSRTAFRDILSRLSEPVKAA
ncbi:MAG: HD domain-containing protein [Nitrospira sp.]|nr:HD domain-containing protein [Nitrospira sp.]